MMPTHSHSPEPLRFDRAALAYHLEAGPLRGLTREQQARRLGLSRAGLKNLLNGSTPTPKVSTVARICSALQIPLGCPLLSEKRPG